MTQNPGRRFVEWFKNRIGLQTSVLRPVPEYSMNPLVLARGTHRDCIWSPGVDRSTDVNLLRADNRSGLHFYRLYHSASAARLAS